jgi:L-arabinose isomerase
MPQRPTAGLLPMYIELYDQTVPDCRAEVEAFRDQVVAGLQAQGIEVVAAPVCRLQAEFAAAVRQIEEAGADLLVTLHLAYSPSLESIDALCATELPLLALDTTPDHAFGPDVDPARIMYNHGIHGVMDMTAMLRRRGKPYEIVAGHVTESDVLFRAADIVRAAHAARRMRRTLALRIGDEFQGMGDFAVTPEVLAGQLGIVARQVGVAELRDCAESVSDAEVEAEVAADRAAFEVAVDDETHRRSARVGLALRKLLDQHGAGAFSVNFLSFQDADGPANTVPFLEISKAMSRGMGYAGEGDLLTASLVGALLSVFPETTFTEIFCPDWAGGTIFLAHMGEVNPAVAAATPRLVKRPFPFTPALNPGFLACAPKPGPAVFVNLAPGPDDSFRLIVAPVEVVGDSDREDFKDKVRGWMRPQGAPDEFLEAYSRLGGTHHSALVLGDHAEALVAFAGFAGLECWVLDQE